MSCCIQPLVQGVQLFQSSEMFIIFGHVCVSTTAPHCPTSIFRRNLTGNRTCDHILRPYLATSFNLNTGSLLRKLCDALLYKSSMLKISLLLQVLFYITKLEVCMLMSIIVTSSVMQLLGADMTQATDVWFSFVKYSQSISQAESRNHEESEHH